MISNYLWIDDDKALIKALEEINQSEFIAVDTEFERTRTYFLNPAVLQLRSDKHVLLIDLVNTSLYPILADALNAVIIHSGSEDLELFMQIFKRLPDRVFDTQVAASLCGFGSHVSYQNIVYSVFNVELPKDSSRTDWLKRPLTDAQVEYAINDVKYLHGLQEHLVNQLKVNGLYALFVALNKRWVDRSTINLNNKKTFTKISKSERLSIPEKQKLWVLLEWREREAVRRNKPRTWILKNTEVTDIVKKVKDKADFKQFNLHPSFIKYNAESIVKQMNGAAQVDPSSLPQIVRLSPNQSIKYGQMKDTLERYSEAFDIAPSIIINNADLKELAFVDGSLEQVVGWDELRVAYEGLNSVD